MRELARRADALDLRVLNGELLDDVDGHVRGDLVEGGTRGHLITIQPVAVDAEGEPLDVHHGLHQLGVTFDEVVGSLDEVVADARVTLTRARVGPEQAKDLLDAPALELADVFGVGGCHGLSFRVTVQKYLPPMWRKIKLQYHTFWQLYT